MFSVLKLAFHLCVWSVKGLPIVPKHAQLWTMNHVSPKLGFANDRTFVDILKHCRVKVNLKGS